jgi:hypothetical protein
VFQIILGKGKKAWKKIKETEKNLRKHQEKLKKTPSVNGFTKIWCFILCNIYAALNIAIYIERGK